MFIPIKQERGHDYWIFLGLTPHFVNWTSVQFSSVQLLSCVWLLATPWTAACQASLSITNAQSLLKLMSTKSVMPSNHLILCCPLLFLPSIFPSIRVKSLWDSPHFVQHSSIWGFTRKPMKKRSENSNFMTCHAIDKVHLKNFVQNYFMQCFIAPFVSQVR